jgi:type IV pilus assembly protein PilQ
VIVTTNGFGAGVRGLLRAGRAQEKRMPRLAIPTGRAGGCLAVAALALGCGWCGVAWGQVPGGALEELLESVGASRASGDAAAPGGEGGASEAGEDRADAEASLDLTVSEYATVEMRIVNEDLRTVLSVLAERARVNLIVSREVDARVTAKLFDVTFEEALDALLHVNGYGWYREGNFVYVEPIERIRSREASLREVEHRVVHLSYLNATDAAEFASPLLSEAGSIKTNLAAEPFSLPESQPVGAEDYALSSMLVVYDYPEHIEEVVDLIESLDTRPQQVLVEATILQTDLSEANAFGVDFALVDDINFLDFFDIGGPLGVPSALAQTGEGGVAPSDNRALGVSTSIGNFSGQSSIRASIIADDAAFFIRALDAVSDTTILANPKVLTLNRQPARVLVGRKIGFLNTTSTETATTQTVEFLDTGTQLSFRPFVSREGTVRLELTPRVSEGVIREASDATGAAVTIPDEITQELTTNVLVPDGATVVLGGLFREQTEMSRSQVPVLGDIPLVGSAFRGHDDSTARSEVIFMITPTIMSDGTLLEDGERGVEHVERVRAGSRQGTLPWSRDRQTRNLNVRAEELIRAGELDKAAWMLRRSLELNPNQPDVRRIRERLFNDEAFWPSRSVLEQVLRDDRGRTLSGGAREAGATDGEGDDADGGAGENGDGS